MPAVLDIVALRSLVAVADCGGFHRAAESLVLSQSAVSQHVRRLEKTLGRPLVERAGRSSRFTPDGEQLVAEARRIILVHDDALTRLGVRDERDAIVLGSTEHAADEILPHVTSALRRDRPELDVRFRLDRSTRLNEAVERGAIDLAMYIGDVRGVDSVPAGALPLRWHAAPGWRRPPGPLPLVVIDSPCTIRRRALTTLADHDITAAVVGEAGHLAGVLNAVRGGLGVALLAGASPAGLTLLADLPTVRPEPVYVRARPGCDPTMITSTVAAVRSLFPLGPHR